MPVTLKLTFPGGRYHATPWGRHVNEGVPEWPPSPWRLLRALVAVWKRTCPDLSEDEVRPVLAALAAPPRFHLPSHRVAHTRHYMPWEKKGPADRTLVFDTFVAVGRNDPLFIQWPGATLAAAEEKILQRLVGNMTSFGRAEGWVEAEVAPEVDVEWNCCRAAVDDPNPVPILCPDGAAAFGSEHYPKKATNPEHFLFDCPRWHLCLDTQTIHKERWPRVPGAVWVNYTSVAPSTTVVRAKPQPATRPKVARFLLDGPVLPLVTETISVAEAFRVAAMSRFRKWCERHPDRAEPFVRADPEHKYSSRTFSGKEVDGTMRRDHHHAYFLPESQDSLRVTHLSVFAEDGFEPGEVAALTSLRSLKCDSIEPLSVQLIGLGQPSDFPGSTVWVSATPYIAFRHAKSRGTKRDPREFIPPEALPEFLAHVFKEDWNQREDLKHLATPEVEFLADPLKELGWKHRSLQFRRGRNRRGDDGYSRPFGALRLTFPDAVRGPLCVGYASHFGMGQFRPQHNVVSDGNRGGRI